MRSLNKLFSAFERNQNMRIGFLSRTKNENTEPKKIRYGYVSDVIAFCKSHKILVWVLIFVMIASFGYEVCNFSISPDEEREIVRAAGTAQEIKKLALREQRYVTWIIKQILTLDGVFTPAVESFLAVVFHGLSAIVFCMLMQFVAGDKKIKEATFVVFSVLYVTYPCVVAEFMSYDVYNDIESLLRVLMACAQYDLLRFEKYHYNPLLLRSALICILLFTNETTILAFVMTSAMLVFYYTLYSEKPDFVQVVQLTLKFFFVFLFAICVVYGAKLFLFKGNGYQSGFIQWDFSEPLGPQVKTVIKACLNYLTDPRWLGNEGLLIGSVLAVLSIIAIAVESRNVKGIYVFLLFAAAYFFAFSIIWICGGPMPLREMVTLPFLSGFVWSINVECFSSKKYISALLLICALYIGFRQVLYLNRAFTGSHLCAQLDMEMGYKIGTDIQAAANSTAPSQPIVFVGRYQHPAENIYRLDASGQSIFYRNRTVYPTFYLRYLGFNFIHANDQVVEEAEKRAKSMPAYPLEGYVQTYDDMIIIKLSGAQEFVAKVIDEGELDNLKTVPAQSADKCGVGWIGYNGVYFSCDGEKPDEGKRIAVTLDDEYILVTGWACDFVNRQPLSSLYIYVGDTLISCEYGQVRTDVAHYFSMDSLCNVGFSTMIPVSFLEEDGDTDLQFIMISADGSIFEPAVFELTY